MAQGIPSWLNRDFVENTLQIEEKNDSIRVIDILTELATKKGDNFTSIMFRVTVVLSRRLGSRNITERRTIIVKVPPKGENAKRVVEEAGLFCTEVSMIRETLPKMNAKLGFIKPFNAKGYTVQKDGQTILIFEDLRAMGYKMADRLSGLDITHSLLAIRNLARFHACSVAICEKDSSEGRIYNRGMFSNQTTPDMIHFFNSGIKAFGEEIAHWPEFSPEYSEKVINFSEKSYQETMKVCELRENEFNVINHGDFWVNNMLFRYDTHGKVIDHIFVDFQLCLYGSPAIDILYFLNTSVSSEVYENDVDILLEEYCETLREIMHFIGCRIKPVTVVELKKSLFERETYGMVAALTVLPILLTEESQAKNLEELLDDNKSSNHRKYSGQLFRRVMSKRFPKWYNMGILDR